MSRSLSPCHGMHVCTNETSVYLSSKRVFRESSQNPCELQGKDPLYGRLRGGSNPQRCIKQDSEPNTLPTELFRPLMIVLKVIVMIMMLMAKTKPCGTCLEPS